MLLYARRSKNNRFFFFMRSLTENDIQTRTVFKQTKYKSFGKAS